jgi:transcriptional regulator of heat shock response
MYVTDLESRRNNILKAVVDVHIDTALPVGSSLLSRRFQFNLSPATIRNTMADLEREGYISQPYTSAGRIPTDKGYRYYVDSLMEVEELVSSEEERIEQDCLSRQIKGYDDLLSEISRILCKRTNYTALVHFRHPKGGRFYLEGTSFILEQPEFQDTRKVKLIFRAFDEKIELLEIMERDLKTEGVNVHIGRENRYEDLKDCSLITSSYKLSNRFKGTLGIIGPKRMSYSRVISVVNYVANLVTKIVS